MRRRAYLAAGLVSVAGCVNVGTDAPAGGEPEAETSPSVDGESAGGGSFDDLPVPREELKRGAPRDAIPAITEPAFAADWSGVAVDVDTSFGETATIEPRLDDEDLVVGVVRDGDARAYPLRLLNWHEVCNDDFHGPLLVTYCPLCRTGLVAERRVDGEATTFGVSGLLYRSNLVMYDEPTGSLWSQVGAVAISGDRTGTRLDLEPSTITSLESWRTAHPDTSVLLPPPESNTVVGRDAARDYRTDPYASYAGSRRVGLGREAYDDRLHPKTLVVGVASDGVARAYPLEAVESDGLINDVVGDLPVVVTTDGSGNLVAYVRRVDGERVAFAARDADAMAAAGSVWRRTDGLAVDGPHEGTALARANDLPPLFWFSWADRHEDSEIYGG